MPKYAYRAIDPHGVRVSGELEASDPDAVVSQLTAQGCRIENVQMLLTASDVRAEEQRAPSLSAGEAREIGGHIAEVVSAGLPLEGGLAAVAEEFPGGRVRRALVRIVRKLEAGNDLESALDDRPARTVRASLDLK